MRPVSRSDGTLRPLPLKADEENENRLGQYQQMADPDDQRACAFRAYQFSAHRRENRCGASCAGHFSIVSDCFRSSHVCRTSIAQSGVLTRSSRSADAQHSCCKNAEQSDKRSVHCNRSTFDRSWRRWQLATRDRIRSHFREGPGPVVEVTAAQNLRRREAEVLVFL